MAEQQELIPTEALGWRCPHCNEWFALAEFDTGRNMHCDPTPPRLGLAGLEAMKQREGQYEER